ncbi:hypothetical protein [Brucella pituitosa]|uniref:hypothetical protein n=1 Tax=Brucella pituitosa TaxID=571256 RepID=UPI00126023BF|nr:hypothetical protein [Brucella pituitosa]
MDSFLIDQRIVERVLEDHDPWYQRNQSGDLRYFAVCPKCENPIQLVNVTGTMSPRAPSYGRHEHRKVWGFDFFDGDMLRTCPFVAKNVNPKKSDRRPLSETSLKIIRIAVGNFDHVVSVLQEDMGVNFSNKIAETMLDAWFTAQGYNYNGANLENIPWMIAYFAVSTNLYGQFLMDELLIDAIKAKVSGAQVLEDGKFLRKRNESWFDVRFSTLRHRISRIGEHDVEEHLMLSIGDFTNASLPLDAVRIYRKQIIIDPAKFTRRMLRSRTKGRSEELLAIARDTAGRHNFEF